MIKPTTVLSSVRLNNRLGAEIIISSETFQHTGSFKFRGAWYMASHVPNTHLITSSSGNFGQAIAYACQVLKKRCTVVMPHDSVAVKVEAVREFGAEIDFVDVAEKSRADRVAELAREFPDAYVASGYDDDLMIAGNSSLGKELVQLADRVDTIVVPVSGGGLASGVITGLRAAGVNTPVLGAEPLLADHVTRSLRAGRLIEDDFEAKTIADGARTNGLGIRNWHILKGGLAGVIAVSEETIGEGLRMLFTFANLKVEPTGALSLGALLTSPERFRSQRVCCIVSGGNVDEETYAELLLGKTAK